MLSGGRADEGHPARFTDLGERMALREESVAGMNRVGAGNFRCGQDARNVQIALAGEAGPMHTRSSASRTGRASRSASEIGDHGPQTEIPAGRDDPDRDFTAIRDQDLVEHVSSP